MRIVKYQISNESINNLQPKVDWRILYSSIKNGFFLLLSSKIATFGAGIVIFWIVVAVIAPIAAPYSPTELAGPILKPPNRIFLLGTDHLGRDILSRLMWGARLILLLAPSAVILASLIGSTLGLMSGYIGRWVDDVIMRILDAMLAFPTMLIYLVIISSIGPSAINVVFAISISGVPPIARIVRSLVLDLRTREFVLAARMRGEHPIYIMFIEILPNSIGPIIVDASIRIGYAAFHIGTLGFLGLGLPPPNPDWGGMINEGRSWILVAPWMVLEPSIAISSLVVGLNLFGDGIREIMEKA